MKEKKNRPKEEIQSEGKNGSGLLVWIRRIIIVCIILVLPLFCYEAYKYQKAKEEYESIPDIDTADMPSAVEGYQIFEGTQEEWPKDALFVEKDRSLYKGGDLRLIVPKLKLDETIWDGTSREVLKQGPGLYTCAQMPGEGDRNVSIAGHRTGYGGAYNIFYYIDTLEEGDYMYLTDHQQVYCYVYRDTKIVEPDDISVLYLQGYACLTLTSCHPLGKNNQRIIVQGELKSIQPYTEGMEFAAIWP